MWREGGFRERHHRKSTEKSAAVRTQPFPRVGLTVWVEGALTFAHTPSLGFGCSTTKPMDRQNKNAGMQHQDTHPIQTHLDWVVAWVRLGGRRQKAAWQGWMDVLLWGSRQKQGEMIVSVGVETRRTGVVRASVLVEGQC